MKHKSSDAIIIDKEIILCFINTPFLSLSRFLNFLTEIYFTVLNVKLPTMKLLLGLQISTRY